MKILHWKLLIVQKDRKKNLSFIKNLPLKVNSLVMYVDIYWHQYDLKLWNANHDLVVAEKTHLQSHHDKYEVL